MDLDGQKGSATPSAMMASVLSRRAKLQDELQSIEREVYGMETTYLQDLSQCGNVLKGYEAFLSSSKNAALLKQSRKFQLEDRLFSLSSITSPAAEELTAARNDGKSEVGVGRPKGGRVYTNRQRKPKKRGGGPRETKRHKHSSEVQYDYDDDPDVVL